MAERERGAERRGAERGRGGRHGGHFRPKNATASPSRGCGWLLAGGARRARLCAAAMIAGSRHRAPPRVVSVHHRPSGPEGRPCRPQPRVRRRTHQEHATSGARPRSLGARSTGDVPCSLAGFDVPPSGVRIDPVSSSSCAKISTPLHPAPSPRGRSHFDTGACSLAAGCGRLRPARARAARWCSSAWPPSPISHPLRLDGHACPSVHPAHN